MNKSVLTLAVLVAMLSLFIAGCGGGDSTLGTSNTNPVAPNLSGDGTLEFSVDWKQISEDYATKGLDGKLIYNSINSIKINAISTTTSNIVATVILPRPTGVTTTSAAMTVPSGTYYVDCAGYTGTIGDGTLISHRRKYVNVLAGSTNPITATLGVSIIGGTLTPPTTYAQPGDTIYWSNNDTTTAYEVISSGASMDITIPAFDPNSSVAGQNEKGFTFTTSSPTAGYAYNIYKTTDLTTIIATGYVKVALQSGATYAYSTSSSKVTTKVDNMQNHASLSLTKDSSGNIYALDGTANNSFVEKYNSAGTYVATYGTNAQAGSVVLSSIAVDNAGYMYLATGTTGILVYNAAGTYAANLTTTVAANSLAYSIGGNLVASNAGNIVYGAPSSGSISTWTTMKSDAGAQFTSIATDASRNIFATNGGGSNVVYIAADGTYYTIDNNGTTPPSAVNRITYSTSGSRIYTSNATNVCTATVAFPAANTVRLTWSLVADNTTSGTNVITPVGLANNDSNYYVIQKGGAIKYGTLASTLSGSWNIFGGLGTNSVGDDITRDSNGYIYVTDSASNRIVKFDSSLGYLKSIYTTAATNGIAVDDSSNIYATTTNAVYKFNSAGTLQTWPSTSITFSALAGVVLNSSYVYVADGTTIYRFDPSGVQQTGSGVWAPLAVNLSGNIGSMAIDSSGNIYTTSISSGVVRKVTSAGTVSTFATVTGNGKAGIAVDASGYVYVVDSIAATPVLYKYSPAGTLLTTSATTGWTLPTSGITSLYKGVMVNPSNGYLYLPGVFNEGGSPSLLKYIGVFAPNSI